MDQSQLDKAKKVKVTNSSAFAAGPAHGVLDGEPITITHVGDADGMSPVFLVVDGYGQSAWVSQSDVTITDPRFLPTNTQQAIATGEQRVPAGSRSSR